MLHLQEFCQRCLPMIIQTRNMSRSQHWRVMEEAPPKFVKYEVRRARGQENIKIVIPDNYNIPMITGSVRVNEKELAEMGESELASFKCFSKHETYQYCRLYDKRWNKEVGENNMYKKLIKSFDMGFIQFREHMLNLYTKPGHSSCTKHLITGNVHTGKSMTCYAAVLNAKEQKQICVPLINLDRWFVETKYTALVRQMVKEDGVMKEKWETPLNSKSFLKHFLELNTELLTEQHVLLRDCYWAPEHYSFKGTPLKEVINYGISTKEVAGAIIKELLATLIETKVPVTIVVDDIDMMHHIPDTMFRSHRLPGVSWKHQPPLTLDRMPLFTHVKDMIKKLEVGSVYLATGKDNSPEALATINNALPGFTEVKVPTAPSPLEYEAYLQLLRRHGWISRDLSIGEVNELKFLSGMGYEYTYIMLVRM